MRFTPTFAAALLVVVPALGWAVPGPTELPGSALPRDGFGELPGDCIKVGLPQGPLCSLGDLLSPFDDTCETETCQRLRLDDDSAGNESNVLDTSPLPTAAGRPLYWGDAPVWHGGADGTGSGLDADLLDGRDSSSFAPSDHHHDQRYYSKDTSDGRFLGKGERAADSQRLDGLERSAFATAGHRHDDRYAIAADLAGAGTINDPSNPVEWSRLKGVPPAFADGTDDRGAFSAGFGLLLSDETFAIDPATTQQRVSGVCAPGAGIRAIGTDGAVTCEEDDVGVYAAGAGLRLDGNQFFIPPDGVAGSMVLDGSLAPVDLSFDPATQAELGVHAGGADHDGRYFTQAESDARFLGLQAKAADADRLDGIDATQLLRNDVDGVLDGNLDVASRLRVGAASSSAVLSVGGPIEGADIDVLAVGGTTDPLPDWEHRRPLSLNNRGAALQDVPVAVTVDTAALIAAGKMRDDCGDARFTGIDGASLNYWLEQGCDTDRTLFSVRFPLVPGGLTRAFLYYGNPAASSRSDPLAAHELYDAYPDFAGWSDARTSTCGGSGLMGGVNLFGSNAVTQKSLQMTAGTYRLEFTFTKIDSWDGEQARALVGGTVVWSRNYDSNSGGSNVCGRDHGGGLWHEVMDPVSVGFSHPGGSATVRFESSLDQPADDEAWGVGPGLSVRRTGTEDIVASIGDEEAPAPFAASALVVTNLGRRVGIGTEEPEARLHVAGDAIVDGHLYAHASSHVGDIAEPVAAAGAVAGDVVVSDGFDPMGKLRVARSTEAMSRRVVGVISTNPSLILAGSAYDTPLAVAGIVPVRAVGAVAEGDLLTTSTVPGHAMACPVELDCRGAIVGKALEGQAGGLGRIRVLLSLG